ncbi:MAG: ATP-binding protein [Anaerolineae bacterium]|nr:ATP-binding protein [Anaerolineae bacterium]NUQ02815.1 ATP-binding protein [Anaerolineae bacterium]
MAEPVTNGLSVSGDADHLGESLQRIRDFVMSASAAAGLDKQSASRLRLAVDEIATNIILYGYRDAGKTGVVWIESALDAAKLRVTLIDQGLPFDPLEEHDMPTDTDVNMPIDERQIGGWGIFLVVKNVDEFKYEYVDGKNFNHFVMLRAPQA